MYQALRTLVVPFALALLGLGASGGAHADPPSRVARLSYESGVVTFSPAGDTQWARAALNRPLVTGDRLWVDADSRAELQLGGAAIRVGDGTSASLLNVDDRTVQLQLAQGSLSIRVWRIASGQQLEVDTPNLAYVVRRPGRYRIDVDPADPSTTIIVRQGQADVYGDGASFRMPAGDGYRFYDTGLRDYDRFAAGPPDDLERWADARDSRWEHSVSARYVPPGLIGYQDLDDYGRWQPAPGYGQVWFPTQVGTDWAPYRDGHWAWVDPWGWTWIDDAPWGFACSHYGRWASIGGRWGWVPGPVAVQPVYAPALVAFIGGSALDIALHLGGGPAVAWFPLAPREVYHPAYQVSRDYFTRVNVTNTVVNVTQVTNVYNTNVSKVVYVNQRVPGAVVAVPANAFVQAQPVAAHAIRVRAPQIAAAVAAPTPRIAPVATSMLGPHPVTTHPQAAAALERPVVAHTAPPPPPAPVTQRLAALAARPGQPVPPPAHASAAAAPVKVVPAPPAAKAPTAPPPPAPNARAQRRQPAAGPAAAAPQRAAPAVPPNVPPPAAAHSPVPRIAPPAVPPGGQAARPAAPPPEVHPPAPAARVAPPAPARPPIAGTPPTVTTPPAAAVPRAADAQRAREDARRRPEPVPGAAPPAHPQAQRQPQSQPQPQHPPAVQPAPREAPPAPTAVHEGPHPPAAVNAPGERTRAAAPVPPAPPPRSEAAAPAPRAAPPEPHPAPRAEVAPARPAPHAEGPVPHPAPRAEAPPSHPAPRAEAPPSRPAPPRVEPPPPRAVPPTPRTEAPPHPAAPAAAVQPRPVPPHPNPPGRANGHRPEASEPRR